MLGREYTQTLRQKGAYTFAGAEVLAGMRGIEQGVRLGASTSTSKRVRCWGWRGFWAPAAPSSPRCSSAPRFRTRGEVLWLDRHLRLRAPKDAIRVGMGYCTEDRKAEGIYPHLSVKENITIAMLPQLSRGGVVSPKKQMEIVNAYIDRLKIKTPSPEQPVRLLSGGNQQKALLARWLAMNPRLVILDEPTRGIDVGPKAEIERLIRNLPEAASASS